MEIKLALLVLDDFNKWRRGEEIEQPNPTQVGEAIDVLIDYVKSNI